MKVFCVPCAAKCLADITLDPEPRPADYVIDGMSMCGSCALPRLYDLSGNLPAPGRDKPVETSVCRNCHRTIHRVRSIYWEDDHKQMVCPATPNGPHAPS